MKVVPVVTWCQTVVTIRSDSVWLDDTSLRLVVIKPVTDSPFFRTSLEIPTWAAMTFFKWLVYFMLFTKSLATFHQFRGHKHPGSKKLNVIIFF